MFFNNNRLANLYAAMSASAIARDAGRLYNFYKGLRQARSIASASGGLYRDVKRIASGLPTRNIRGVRATGYTRQTTKRVRGVYSRRRGMTRYRKGKSKRSLPIQNRKYAQGSFIYNLERGSSIAPTVSGVLGHTTCPRLQMERALFGCILRRLFTRAGLRCPIPSRAVEGIVTGDVVEIFFEYGAASLDACNFGLTTGATLSQSITAAVNVFTAKLAGLASPTLAYGNVRIYKVAFYPNATGPTGSHVELDLTSAKIAMDITSKFCIQNRSVGETGDEEADEVDNTPVEGRCYQGYGTGPDSRYQTDATSLAILHGDTTYGVIAVSNPENMSEAPLTYTFNNIKRTGYTRIAPGTIHTSRLKYSKVISIESLCRAIFIAPGDGNIALRLGKYSFYVLEKVLETNNSSPLAMNLGYQHDLYMNFKLINPNTDYPVPEFFRN